MRTIPAPESTLPIDRHSPLPLWAQVLADLRGEIAAAGPGSPVPPEMELVRRYGVSRSTVREALRRLREEGVVSSERGRGSVVRAPLRRQQGALWSLYDAVEHTGHTQDSDVLALRRVRHAEVSARLEMPAATWLVHLARVRRLDGTPIALDDAWLPAAVAAPLLDADFRHTALYDELAHRCGVVADGGEETVSAILPSAQERSRLGIPARTAALLLERRSCANGRFVEWRRTVVAGTRFSLRTEWDPAGTQRLSLSGQLAGID